MVTARTVAMSANRIFDADLDAKNPRTARRAVPLGSLSPDLCWQSAGVCSFGFVAATAGVLIFLSQSLAGRRFPCRCWFIYAVIRL